MVKTAIERANRVSDGPTFDALRQIIHQASGIAIGADKAVFLHARLMQRVAALQLPNDGAYLRYVQAHPEEVDALVDAVSTNFTSFFREPQHFEFLKGVVKDYVSAGESTLRFWCAASSTGEEPYTLAMVLSELQRVMPFQAKILATDINQAVIRHAMGGGYSEKSLATVSDALRDRYFQRDDSGTYWASSGLRSMVTFRRHNLTHLPSPVPACIDMVLCRNVLIYFEDDLRYQLAEEFYRVLRPGGYLLIGHSESLSNHRISLSMAGPSIYQKSGSP